MGDDATTNNDGVVNDQTAQDQGTGDLPMAAGTADLGTTLPGTEAVAEGEDEMDVVEETPAA